MAIQKRTTKTGKTRWLARYRDVNGRQRSKTFNTQREAKEWVADQTSALRQGRWVDPSKGTLTVRQLMDDWAGQASRSSTRKSREHTAGLLGELSEIPIAKLRRSHIQAWVNALADGEVSAQGTRLTPLSVRTKLKHLRTALNQAVFDGLIPSSPAQRITTEPVSSKVDVDKVPTPEQVRAMLLAAKNLQRKNAYAVVLTLAGTGLRAGELCGLQVGDVEFLKGRVHVRRQLNEQGEVAPLKTLTSRRVIPLPGDVALALSPLCAGDADAPVFMRPDGLPMTRRDVASIFYSIQRSTGLAFSAHSLRHYYASGLIAAGVDVRSVQGALGHASASVTLDTYSHLWPDSVDRVSKASENLVCTLRALDDKKGTSKDGS